MKRPGATLRRFCRRYRNMKDVDSSSLQVLQKSVYSIMSEEKQLHTFSDLCVTVSNEILESAFEVSQRTTAGRLSLIRQEISQPLHLTRPLPRRTIRRKDGVTEMQVEGKCHWFQMENWR